ncbi:hypothetical protein ACFX58_04455 [Sphingomonas sp. NCPPB 2930]
MGTIHDAGWCRRLDGTSAAELDKASIERRLTGSGAALSVGA